MLVYYPHLYICDSTTFENVADYGTFIIMFQEYSGSLFSNQSWSRFKEAIQNGVENFSMFLCSYVAPERNQSNPITKYADIIPVIDIIKYADTYYSHDYKFKLVFSDNGDYLISSNTVRGFSGNNRFKAYDSNNNLLLNGWEVPISIGYGYLDENANAMQMLLIKAGDVENNKFKSNATLYFARIRSNTSYTSISPDSYYEYTVQFFNRHEANTPPSQDPYNGAGDSETGGGGGSFDGSSDPIDIPSLPSVGATNTGFISLFVPSESQVRSVANYLWSSLFDISTFFKIFENPMDCILGLSVVPVTVPTSGSAQITVGNIELSGITLPLASAQYVEVDCGTISFEDKFFGSYLDYEPYTKMAIFLPYCGVHQINADDIMGKVIRVVYHVDILTGSCVAFVKCGDSVLYQFNGACATNIPITNISYNSTIENSIRIAVNIGTTVATAGASAPLSAGAETVGHTAQNIARGVSLAGSTAEGALSLKPSIGRSGALGGTTGILAGQKPYLIITRPRLCKPKNQDYYKGYPSFVQTTVGDLIGKGYTEFDTIIISTLYLTDNEEAELERIMQGGVYL